jgi:hypothetical protein
MQAMQRLLRQKRQMFFCERGRQVWHYGEEPANRFEEEPANRFTCVGIQILTEISVCLRYMRK